MIANRAASLAIITFTPLWSDPRSSRFYSTSTAARIDPNVVAGISTFSR